MTADQEVLDQLCKLHGIAPDYFDIWGQRHVTSPSTQRALLAALGVDIATSSSLRQALVEAELRPWRRLLAPVQVVRRPATSARVELTVAAEQTETLFHWTLVLENGHRHGGQLRPCDLEKLAEHQHDNQTFLRCGLTLPFLPGDGYHRFELTQADQPATTEVLTLIVAPESCYQPPALADDGRVWGFAIQLYALRSQRNWGIGDLGDLKAVLEDAAKLGAAVVGLNPLHALFPHNPSHASPYSPSSRLFFNVLYLDVENIPDFAECQAAQEAVNEPQFQARLRALRSSELVDYAGVGELKFAILERLYRHFRQHHLDGPRGRAFREFRAADGEALRTQALFEALQEHFYHDNPESWGWPVWPAPYRDPHSPEVAAFAESHRERVEFYEYLQWQVAQQIEAAGRRSLELGLGIGIYQDLAVSVDSGGAETWANQELYAINARLGAPPDELGPLGQDWGLPPWNPERLRATAYRPFIEMLRRIMYHAGALRIDHVMGLMRLFWIPTGTTPAEGAYVSYPFEDLLGVLALESQRNRCLVIGEDLGTVPDPVRQALAPLGVLSYRLFYFEKKANGNFKQPDEYPAQALVAVTTHDLPTLNGYWQGRDLDLRDELGLMPSSQVRDKQIVERAQDRARLRVVLEREGLLPPDVNVHAVSPPEMSPELVRAIYVYLARSPAQVLAVQLEDVFCQTNQINLPGTMDEYPNWRYKLALNLEDWLSDARLQALAEELREERGIAAPPQPLPLDGQTTRRATIPNATYRLQFNSGFTFDQASQLVPYFAALGVSHCYASPYLKARPGSSHGYDIIDHNAINPEIGGSAGLEHFCAALRGHGLGQILDMVPNHMGVMGSDNAWWLDVLENGQAAAHAPFFDIDWQPFKERLRGKVLLPVLGNHYGLVLENGELQLIFEPEKGAFSAQYYEHRFPIDPREYPRILGFRLDQLEARLGADNALFLEYQSLVTAFGHLPARSETDPDRFAERSRDKEIHKRHLRDLFRRSPDIAWFIEESLQTFNGSPGEPQSFDALHELLENQAYLLAFWRVASDDINYRRFFDINDLAGVRMENETVFRETHRLVMELVATGKLDGLRLDHPDGLYNPKQYFQRLQNCLVSPFGTIHFNTHPGNADEKPLYVVVEKILESYEHLPEDWPVHGSTGYEFTNLVNGLFVDAGAEERFEQIYSDFIGRRIDFEELLYNCKRLIIQSALISELNVLANQLSRIAQADRRTRDFTLNGLRNALEEIVACFPVYRTYITAEGVSDEDRRYVDWAVTVAKKRSRIAEMGIFAFVREVLLTAAAEGKAEPFRQAVTACAMKFQQYTGPVMAKGLEDTSFYRYNRLVSLNEVGGDPRRFGISVNAFHHANQERVRHWPHAMLSTSTHDSKRSEDVRARINVLSERADEWERLLQRWSRLNAPKKRLVEGRPAPSRNDEYLLYQILLGAWPLEPLDEAGLQTFCERIEGYMLKAVREAKVDSSWINPDAEYEEAVVIFVRALLEDPDKSRFLNDFMPAQRYAARIGLFNSLSQTLLKLTVPGAPDIYQGTELWDFSLVDPDNRRPVDYAKRQQLLQELQSWGQEPERAGQARSLLENMADGRIKLYTTWKTLTLRQERAALFRDGEYLPLSVDGARAEHVCAFARSLEQQEVIVVVPRLYVGLLDGASEGYPLGDAVWGDTRLILPGSKQQRYVDVFTGVELTTAPATSGVTLPLAGILEHFPVALLVRC